MECEMLEIWNVEYVFHHMKIFSIKEFIKNRGRCSEGSSLLDLTNTLKLANSITTIHKKVQQKLRHHRNDALCLSQSLVPSTRPDYSECQSTEDQWL